MCRCADMFGRCRRLDQSAEAGFETDFESVDTRDQMIYRRDRGRRIRRKGEEHLEDEFIGVAGHRASTDRDVFPRKTFSDG